MLRTTTACTFSTAQLRKVLRAWCALYILTCKFASRHNGVELFISHLITWLRTRRFSEPTFRPSGATKLLEKQCFATFLYLFAHLLFLTCALCLSAGRGVLRLTRLPRHDRGPVPGGSRSAASCLCTVLRRALYRYSTRSPIPFRAPASSFFSLFLFSDLISSAPLLSDSSHLCFSICPYCRKFDF